MHFLIEVNLAANAFSKRIVLEKSSPVINQSPHDIGPSVKSADNVR